MRKKFKNEDAEYAEEFREMSNFGSNIFALLPVKFPYQSLDYMLSIFSELSQLISQNRETLDRNEELYFDGLFMQIKHIINALPISIIPIADKVKENASNFLHMIFTAELKV